MKCLLLTCAFLLTSAFAVEVTPQQMEEWERVALAEVQKHKKASPEKEFLLYMIAGRELAAYGLKEKSRHYYLLSFQHPSKSDKSEAVVELVNLNRDNKTELAPAIERAKKYFAANPEKLQTQVKQWLAMMESFSQGKTVYNEKSSPHTAWARDARIDELMKDGNATEAYKLLGPTDLKETNINLKIRHDLLATATLGKSAPPLWCKSTLDRYPTSFTWSMRLCRYLEDWRTGKKSSESVQTIREQFKKENPERLHWADILEKL